MEALEAVHWKRREVSLAYRSLIRILQTICPLDALAAFGAQMNRDLHECSLWEASTQALSRLAIPWEVDVPCEAREIIRTRALIVYGNHPSMLSPFLVAAALERDDLKLISCRYVARLIPNLEGDIFPLDPTYERSVREGLRSGVSHMLAMAALYRFDEPRDIAAARLENRASILKAAEHVSRGGATLIFPGGGRERDWYPGLGTLVAEALRHHADPGIYLVPVHEANSSNVRLYRALAGRSSRREPVRLVAATPRSVSEYGFSTSTEPGRIVATLRADYYETFTS